MKIDVSLTVDQTRPIKLTEKTAIVIDVLRATSTIITALANGCRSILPVSSPEEAFGLLNSANMDNLLLGGEATAHTLEGFHLGNSPYEYSPRVVKGKNIIFTTTNGTKAIKKSQSAQEIYIVSLLNAKAAAKKAIESGRDLFIICAGTRGKLSLEDTIAAGLIIDLIKQITDQISLTDIAQTAHNIYHNHQDSIVHTLLNSTNGRNLTQLGFGSDIIFCAQIDKFNMVPQYKDGVVMLAN